MDLLHRAHRLRDLISHKMDILQHSIALMEGNLAEMCHQALANSSTSSGSDCIIHRCCPLRLTEAIVVVNAQLPSYGGSKRWSMADMRSSLCDLDQCSVCQSLAKDFALEDSISVYPQMNLPYQYSIQQINIQLLTSGAVMVTGGENELICTILCSNTIWSCLTNINKELSALLCFIVNSHRSERSSVILDARGASRSVLQLLMESLHTAQRDSGNAIDVARVLIDKPTQTGSIIKSSRRTSTLPVDILTSTKCLQKYSVPENLPIYLDGEQDFNSHTYLAFHQELDTGISQCTESLDGILMTSHTLSRVPQTFRQCSHAIRQHKTAMSKLYSSQDSLVASCHAQSQQTYQCTTTSYEAESVTLPHRGRNEMLPSKIGVISARATKNKSRQSNEPVPAPRPNLANLLLHSSDTKNTLDDLATYTKGTDIYSSLIDNLNTLTVLATDVSRLKTLADERLNKLYGYKKIWFYMEEITKKLTVLKRAHEVINKHRTPSCNLRTAKHQLRSFSKTEPSIKRVLRKGEELLSNVLEGLHKSGLPIPWLKQLATKLDTELKFVSSLLEKTRDLITRTNDCYTKLDKAYDWALDAMKHLSQDSVENYMTQDALELLATGLKSFMEQKTYLDDVAFDEISKEARFLSNRKLSEQCKIAKRRCSETRHLLKTRCAVIAKRQQEVRPAGASAVAHDNQQSSGDQGTTTSETRSQDWRLQSSQSAPATPALALRCNNNNDLNRRSQSLEDEIANEILQCIQSSQLDGTSPDVVPMLKAQAENRLLSYGEVLDIPALPPSCCTTGVSLAVETSMAKVSDVMIQHDYVSDVLEPIETSVFQSIPENNNDFSSKLESEMEVCSIESESSEYVFEGVDDENSSICHTVYRGDRFLEHTDVTIPLDDLHLNNNHLPIQSPTMEDGHVVYAPANKPVPTKRFDLTQCTNAQSSTESYSVENGLYSPEEIPQVNFSIETDKNSSIENISQCSSSLVVPSTREFPSQCKLSPVLTPKQKQKAMQKRKSFHGFTSAIAMPILNFARNWRNADDSAKRLSVPEHQPINEEILVSTTELPMETSLVDQLSHIECSLKGRDDTRLLRLKRMDKTMSLVTGSSDSLPSLPEDDVADSASNSLPRSSKYKDSSKVWTPVPVNSHLMHRRVLPSHRSASMADLRLTESEIKSRITLAHIMDELVQTERDYVIALRLVVESYIPELGREDVPQTLRGKRAIIFGNIEKIYEFHDRYFLEDMAKCENDPFKISRCFLNHESEFLMYALYNKNKPQSDSLMSEHGSSFFRDQQVLMGDKMDLSSYLLKPVQRMGKYALILKQILKECPESSPEYQDLASAEEMIRFCLQHGNDLLAMDALQDCDVNLQEQGTLLLQGEFTVWKNRRKMIRHIFLFEHLLVLSKTKRIGAGGDQYIYKTSLKTADIGLTENVGTSGVKFEIWFRKRTGDSWAFQASSSQIKNRWVNVIEKLLWTQALKNRETRLSHLSTMGVGRKPSLDLKKSANNINDRFIPSLNKANTIGSRHSMDTLYNADHFDATKKRPHSVISLAASSSSNSSAGSTGPGTNRRSLPWLDLKAVVTGKGLDSSRSLRLRKMYKSDSKIHRCDSGISSSSDFGPNVNNRKQPQILDDIPLHEESKSREETQV